MKIINFKFSLVFVLLIASCKTIEYPYCIGKTTRELKISWGIIVQDSINNETFELSTNRTIYQINKTKNFSKKIKTLTENEYCKLLYHIHETFLNTQVINEVGDTLQYVQYENPAIGVYTRAIWNPRFRTRNSILFRELFDTLSSKTNYY